MKIKMEFYEEDMLIGRADCNSISSADLELSRYERHWPEFVAQEKNRQGMLEVDPNGDDDQ